MNPALIQKFILEKWIFIKNKLQPYFAKWLAYKEKAPKAAWTLLIGSSLLLFSFLFISIFYLSIRLEWIDRLPTEQELRKIKNNIASEVYSEDGKLLGKYYIQNRINVNLEEISPNLIHALVATEDVRFFDHNGVDFKSWFRVFFKSVLMQDEASGGGSTISQQLAKNLYNRKKYWILSLPVNKVREMIIAKRLERIYSKEELLTLYLNTVSFSDNTYGVKVASKRFFNTNPKDIKVEEAAVLVGMLKGTAIYNPLTHPERALHRRNIVLSQMERYGYLAKNDVDSVLSKSLKLNYSREGNTEGLGTYFREHLRLELNDFLKNFQKPDGSKYNLYTDGLKIHTTIDARMQQYAEEAVAEHMSQLQATFFEHWKKGIPWGDNKTIEKVVKNTAFYQGLKKKGTPEVIIDSLFRIPKKMTIFTWKGEEEREMSMLDSIKYYFTILNTGFLAMNPANGQIKAWVGGIDNKYFQYDHVKSRRQAGSTFKPLVYATALNQGMHPCEYIHNRLTIYTDYDDWKPENADGKYGGVYSMEGGLSQSVNAVTVDLIMQAGIDSVKNLAQNMGITSEIPSVPAIALGTVEVSLYDMLKVYGTFANKGLRPEPRYIRRIETQGGDILVNYDEKQPDFERVLSKEAALMMNKMLQSVVDSGTAKRLRYQYHLKNAIAGKTGTTQHHSDGWFIGYTPNLVAGAWVGAESPKVRFRSIALGQGANTALPIWGRFMNKVLKDPKYKDWRAAQFEPLPDSLYWEMDCPPFLEEIPVEDDWEIEESIESLFDWIFKRKNKDGETSQIIINERPRTRSKRSENIQRQNEKLERKRMQKEKRKKFFDRIFKRGN